MSEKQFKLSPKGLIYAHLIGNTKAPEELANKIWTDLYTMGCDDIGEVGLPALIIRKSEYGEFIPVCLKQED